MKKLSILVGIALLAGLLMVPGLMAQNMGPGGGMGGMGPGTNWSTWGGSWNSPPNPGGNWNDNWKGSSARGVLYMFPKDQSGAVVTGGPYGMLNYNHFGTAFNFQFKASSMIGGTSYTLVYYPEPQPTTDLIVLGTGVASANGKVHIRGAVNTGNLPQPYDANANPVAPSTAAGAQIRLVLTDDIDATGKHLATVNPDKYLFEYNLITFINK